MASQFWKAPEVEDIIQRFMQYHPELIGANIACIFKEKASMSDGRPIVGKISKVSPRYQPLMTDSFDYLIEIGSDAWLELDNAQRDAWVDHILEHAYGQENENTGEMAWKLRTPEFVGFPCIINRHGIGWMSGLAKMATINFTDPVAQDPVARNIVGAMDDDDPFDLE